MKIELDIPIEEFNKYDDWNDVESNAMSSFMSIVTDRVAEKLLSEICGGSYGDVNKILADKINYVKQTIENKMANEFSDEAYAEIRDKVAEKVIENTVERYERSHAYRDIKKQLEIESDSAISTGMKTLISDIVKLEVKKIIKL